MLLYSWIEHPKLLQIVIKSLNLITVIKPHQPGNRKRKGFTTMMQVEMSIQQAKEIAKSIYTDIDAYIESHRAEYEAFLTQEGLFEQEGGDN